QAEDGIRDRTVTGVQTCALPISLEEWRDRDVADAIGTQIGHRPSGDDPAGAFDRRKIDGAEARVRIGRAHDHQPTLVRELEVVRSEERRVGEEGGGRGGWEWGSR